jgi:hypothetical protein
MADSGTSWDNIHDPTVWYVHADGSISHTN